MSPGPDEMVGSCLKRNNKLSVNNSQPKDLIMAGASGTKIHSDCNENSPFRPVDATNIKINVKLPKNSVTNCN